MSSVVVAKFDNRRDALQAARLIRKLNTKVKLINGKDWEDVYFAELIEEGMR